MKKYWFLYFICVLFPLYTVADTIPQSWIGKWEGELVISTQPEADIKMELEIIPFEKNDSSFHWNIYYKSPGNEDKREYELLAINQQKGFYKINEKNSIILDAYFHKNTLYAVFDVQDNLIHSIYRKTDKEIFFEIIMCKTNKYDITGGAENIPQVKTYPVQVVQHAILYKVKNN